MPNPLPARACAASLFAASCLAVLGCVLALTSGPAVSDTTAIPQPFVASYAVTFRGIGGGALQMELRPDTEPGRYVFETQANPSTLARLFISSDAVEHSILEPTAEGIRPLRWMTEDGKSSHKGDGQLQFDWAAGRVTGEVEGKQVSLSTEPALQDRMSIQVSVMTALLQGKEPGTIAMVNDDHIRHYTYTRSGTATMDTKFGQVETVIYESTRPGSNRLSRVWHAPSLDYLPVRMEQVRKGKVETVMTLVALERDKK